MLGAAMLIPAFVDFVSGYDDWQIFIASGCSTMAIGMVMFLATRGVDKGLTTRQAFIMTTLVWIALSAFGALPFYLSGLVPSYTDAFFESISGLTTTGATVMTGLDFMPPGILLWRGILQWLGGLGIIVMAVSVLPMLQIGGMQLFKAEAFETPEIILPRATQISGFITLIFLNITALCMLAYLLAGMDVLDAAVHAMTTVDRWIFQSRWLFGPFRQRKDRHDCDRIHDHRLPALFAICPGDAGEAHAAVARQSGPCFFDFVGFMHRFCLAGGNQIGCSKRA